MSGISQSLPILPTYTNTFSQIDAIADEYPFASSEIIGHSRCGRQIKALSFGSQTEQVLFCGGFHGMEYLTVMLLLRYAQTLCSALAGGNEICKIKISRFLKRRGLIIIPCINPDGTEICINGSKSAGGYSTLIDSLGGGKGIWQANAAGVDINHNFDADFYSLKLKENAAGIFAPSPTRYGGERPESEPETRALTKLCRSRNLRHVAAFHSQGEEIYWDYGRHTPKRSKIMAQIISESSGYKLSQPEPLASGGGFKDWFIEEFHRPGFTIEIGKGKNPLPIGDFEKIYKNLEETLSLCVIM